MIIFNKHVFVKAFNNYLSLTLIYTYFFVYLGISKIVWTFVIDKGMCKGVYSTLDFITFTFNQIQKYDTN